MQATIIVTLDKVIVEHKKGAITGKELWETLKGLFSLAEFSTRHLLLQELVETSLAGHEPVTKFVEPIKRQGRQLKVLDRMCHELASEQSSNATLFAFV